MPAIETTATIKFNLGDEPDPPSNILASSRNPEPVEHHALFCEMAELRPSKKYGYDAEWKETARWIKFEEDVEEGGSRWSKPYVASLSLHSLMELRSTLLSGSMVLDLVSSGLGDLWDCIVHRWVEDGLAEEELQTALKATLSQRFRHQYQRSRKKAGSFKSDPETRPARGGSFMGFLKASNANLRADFGRTETMVSLKQVLSSQNMEDSQNDPELKLNTYLYKKLPPGSEAANILIGEVDFLTRPLSMFVRLDKPLMLGNLTEVPVPTRFLYILLGPKATEKRYHQIGRTIGTLFSDEVFQKMIYGASERDEIIKAVDEFLASATVLPPGTWDPNIRIEPPQQVPSHGSEKRVRQRMDRNESGSGVGLLEKRESDSNSEKSDHEVDVRRTGKLFGGLAEDVKRKLSFYKSDFRDALNSQSLASFIFLYFASMTPLITFGGLMSDLLKQRMGAVETILGRALSGVIWGLTAGQPMVILGSTGPILVYELIIFNLCESMGIDYMSFRVWIGLWSMVQLLAMVAFDLSYLVGYITRFTEESFAALVSAIFVYEAVKKLLHIAEELPVHLRPDSPVISERNASNSTLSMPHDNQQYVPDAFFLSVILFFGTYFVATFLKDFKNASFFPAKIRQVISNFAVILSIAIFVGIDFALGIPTPKLLVPGNLEPTYPERNGSWIVPLFGPNAWWTALAAFIPGLLATILIFMDQQITCVIVNRKENRLRKGHGYHLDLLIVALLTGILSVLGMPWMVADTVLSLTHVNSLKMESSVAAPGERPTFLGVREQRVTNILMAVAIGVSIFVTGALIIIPMPVLFGVFLFMGLNALNGLQFTDRLKLFFMPLKHQPDYIYLRHVKIHRVHWFTVIQLICISVLWVLKSFRETAILFPLMVGALVGVRKLLDFVFSQYELGFLDDIMPETSKRKHEDVQIQIEKRKSIAPSTDETDFSEDGFYHYKLPNGNFLKVPQPTIAPVVENGINFTNEINSTTLWKNVSSADLARDRTSGSLRVTGGNTGKRWKDGDEAEALERQGLASVPDNSAEDLLEVSIAVPNVFGNQH